MSKEMIAAYAKTLETVNSMQEDKPIETNKNNKGLLTRSDESDKIKFNLDFNQPKNRVDRYFIAINKQRKMLNGKV
jgi:hypothetical protein